MQLEILSQPAYLLSELEKLFVEYREKATIGAANQVVTTANEIFLELVRLRMRETGRNAALEDRKPDEFLSRIKDACVEELNQRLHTNVHNTQFLDLDNIVKSLKWTAYEVMQLSRDLAKSKELQIAGDRRQLSAPHVQRTQPIERVEIGLQGAIEGLLVRPLGFQCKLDFEHLGNEYSRSGDWFPFEITKGDLLFVVDDDGSIFISTENFPQELFKHASDEIEALAQSIYRLSS